MMDGSDEAEQRRLRRAVSPPPATFCRVWGLEATEKQPLGKRVFPQGPGKTLSGLLLDPHPTRAPPLPDRSPREVGKTSRVKDRPYASSRTDITLSRDAPTTSTGHGKNASGKRLWSRKADFGTRYMMDNSKNRPKPKYTKHKANKNKTTNLKMGTLIPEKKQDNWEETIRQEKFDKKRDLPASRQHVPYILQGAADSSASAKKPDQQPSSSGRQQQRRGAIMLAKEPDIPKASRLSWNAVGGPAAAAMETQTMPEIKIPVEVEATTRPIRRPVDEKWAGEGRATTKAGRVWPPPMVSPPSHGPGFPWDGPNAKPYGWPDSKRAFQMNAVYPASLAPTVQVAKHVPVGSLTLFGSKPPHPAKVPFMSDEANYASYLTTSSLAASASRDVRKTAGLPSCAVVKPVAGPSLGRTHVIRRSHGVDMAGGTLQHDIFSHMVAR
ncbi:unnamed protein product [Vitrella brassicaformis CCMP3155]|uniref:Uncharacterized protein n=2 Tax=Vitrella brassicaformis TaxID=1169539 RepID=A0A0G4FB47_VITBC|nr:unnamed protein product [Vitrella brassicaformis CCMP3155]|eukprot:CEM10120.1 unnamed protein product [Vitrella brassicaformis CCMP3155]